jgi:hypothetical protein
LATAAFRKLRQFERRPGVSVTPKGQALELTLVRNDIEVRVLVPESVLEWFVDAEDRISGAKVSDSCDYAGYDDTPDGELETDMAEDVAAFVNQLIERNLRCEQDSKRSRRSVIEWFVDGQWQQALPFVAPAA